MKQRILVLGASGFVGRHLNAALAGSDWALPLAAGRRVGSLPGEPAQRLAFDATDQSAMLNALQGVDGVVNCIAGNVDAMAASARVLFTAAASLAAPPRIVHLSSMAVYGPAVGYIDESSALAGTDPYALAKIATEQSAANYRAQVVLRPGIVYGPGGPQWTRRIAGWLFSHRIGDLGAAGDGYCNLLYIDDLVTAIAQALRLPDVAGRVFNLAMAQPPTWNDYFIRFARALGAVPVARIGRRRLQLETKLLAPPLKIAEILFAKAGIRASNLPEPIPPSVVRLCSQDIRLDVSAAEKSLQMSWTELGEGLERSAHWVRQQR
jgi:nucleoside-diphosphate-sugar epimerase